jgi:hypothetical protein
MVVGFQSCGRCGIPIGPENRRKCLMEGQQSGKKLVRDLCREWQHLLDLGKLSREAEYRIRKLVDRTAPIEDKIFLKTVKGQELISQCAEKTRDLRAQLGVPGDGMYQSLTELEACYEKLLKQTYEFRVKAG